MPELYPFFPGTGVNRHSTWKIASETSVSHRSHSWPPSPRQTRKPDFGSIDHCDPVPVAFGVEPGGIGPRVQPFSSGPASARRSFQPPGARSRALGLSFDCADAAGPGPVNAEARQRMTKPVEVLMAWRPGRAWVSTG